MAVIRLARGFTGRPKIIKFSGCYHGHVDSLLVKAGSGALTQGNPDSAGVTPGTAADTLVAEYNNLPALSALFDANAGQVAGLAAFVIWLAGLSSTKKQCFDVYFAQDVGGLELHLRVGKADQQTAFLQLQAFVGQLFGLD